MNKTTPGIDDLTDNELAYEADIRDINLDLPVATIKRALRAKFREERDGSPIPLLSKVPENEDIDCCINKFKELANELNVATSKLDIRKINRLTSRVLHLKQRVWRIRKSCSAEVRPWIDDFYHKVKLLLGNIEDSSEEESQPNRSVVTVDSAVTRTANLQESQRTMDSALTSENDISVARMVPTTSTIQSQSTLRKIYNLNPAVNNTIGQAANIQKYIRPSDIEKTFGNMTLGEMTDIDCIDNLGQARWQRGGNTNEQALQYGTGTIPRVGCRQELNASFDGPNRNQGTHPSEKVSKQSVVTSGYNFYDPTQRLAGVVPHIPMASVSEVSNSRVQFAPSLNEYSSIAGQTQFLNDPRMVQGNHPSSVLGQVPNTVPTVSWNPNPTLYQNNFSAQKQLQEPHTSVAAQQGSIATQRIQQPLNTGHTNYATLDQLHGIQINTGMAQQYPLVNSGSPQYFGQSLSQKIACASAVQQSHPPLPSVLPTWTNYSLQTAVSQQNNIIGGNNRVELPNTVDGDYNAWSNYRKNPVQTQGAFCDRIDALNLDSTIDQTHHSMGNQNRLNSVRYRKTIPVSQWNLKFSGDGGDTMSLSEFIDRVRFHSKARNVSAEELLYSAYDLFTGSALIWYRANYARFNNWSELERELRGQFLPHEYDFYLWREIEDRTQGVDERFGIYLACVQNLFAKLSDPPSENLRLGVLIRNLQPYYTERLCFRRIATVRELTVLCAEIEENRARIARFKPPPSSRTGSLLEPALAYKHRPIPKINSCDHSHEQLQSEAAQYQLCEVTGKRIFAKDPKNMRCFNCQQLGHWSRDCSNPKTNRCCKTCGQKWPNSKTSVSNEPSVNEVECCNGCQCEEGNAVAEEC